MIHVMTVQRRQKKISLEEEEEVNANITLPSHQASASIRSVRCLLQTANVIMMMCPVSSEHVGNNIGRSQSWLSSKNSDVLK